MKKNPQISNKLKVISIFSGAGGLDVGFKLAGYEIALCVENDEACADTLKSNMPNVPVICRDIRDVSVEEILQKSKLKPLETAVVIGGPPCQPFSLAGKRDGLLDPRGTLFMEFVRIVRGVLPRAFLMENVKGLLNWNNGQAFEMIHKELSDSFLHDGRDYKYKLSHKCLNTACFGVPQIRERVFFIGSLLGKTFEFPKETHANPNQDCAIESLSPFKTVKDAFDKLPPPDAPSKAALRVAKTIKKRHKSLGFI